MRYSNFIKQTISNETGIEWNYYNMRMDLKHILQANNSNEFIRQYFKNGGKELPLLINPIEVNAFLSNYFTEGRKERAMDLNFTEKYSLPDDRAVHMVSGFFLGLLIEKCLNGRNTLTIESLNYFPFSYLWFLTFLYHDYGYCVTERENSLIKIPNRIPLLGMNSKNNSNYMNRQSIDDIRQMKRVLGINSSMFYPLMRPFSTANNFSQNNEINEEYTLLCKLTQSDYTVRGVPKIRFSTGTEIVSHQYSSSITRSYYNYCINEWKKADHGIVGGYLFYDRMIKNYISAYMEMRCEREEVDTLSNFYYKDRHFCIEQLPIFSHIADCISAHNIWKQPDASREIYKYYKLDALLSENFKNINYQENPLLYILIVTDSIEPTKVYRSIPPEIVSEAIDIKYKSASKVMVFSSKSNEVPIETLYRKAKELENWTTVCCEELEDGRFVLHI